MQPAKKPHGYQGLSYERPALQAAMRNAYNSLIDFVTTDAFKNPDGRPRLLASQPSPQIRF